MKKEEVPRDGTYLEGFQRGAFAVDEAGKYTLVPTPGWAAEVEATSVALTEQDRKVEAAWELARQGRRSPLAYHAARRQMTAGLLARYAKVNRLRVLWHLQPFGFRCMPLGLALRYAAVLDMPLGDLVQVPERPERLLEPTHG